MCFGKKKSSPAPTPAPVPAATDAAAAQRSAAAQEQAQHQVNAANVISSTDNQLPSSFGAELGGGA